MMKAVPDSRWQGPLDWVRVLLCFGNRLPTNWVGVPRPVPSFGCSIVAP